MVVEQAEEQAGGIEQTEGRQGDIQSYIEQAGGRTAGITVEQPEEQAEL